MRALFSTPDRESLAEIREVAEPSAGPDQVLVRVHAASLNRGELSLLPARPGWQPGQDIAGVVEQVGPGVADLRPGDRVVGVVDQAGWAEKAVADRTRTAALPGNVDFDAACTLGVAGLTALRALRCGNALLGARVLVTGAAGGVGRYAVQLAAVAGAEVTASVGSEQRAAGLRELGVHHVVFEAGELPGQYDLILEGVGGPSLQRSIHAAAPHGLVVLYGGASGRPAEIALGDFRGRPQVRIQGFFIYQTDVASFGRDLEFLAGLMGEGRLRPQIGLTLSWTRLAEAAAALRERRVNGKVVLLID